MTAFFYKLALSSLLGIKGISAFWADHTVIQNTSAFHVYHTDLEKSMVASSCQNSHVAELKFLYIFLWILRSIPPHWAYCYICNKRVLEYTIVSFPQTPRFLCFSFEAWKSSILERLNFGWFHMYKNNIDILQNSFQTPSPWYLLLLHNTASWRPVPSPVQLESCLIVVRNDLALSPLASSMIVNRSIYWQIYDIDFYGVLHSA